MENNKKFTHLHVHTEYSLLDGSAKIKNLVARTKELGMDSIAITDHGSMFGVIQFYKEAKKQGINPILGSEVYMAINKNIEQEPKDKRQYHLVLLAENNLGYQNLMKIVSNAYVDGFYYKPRADKDVLRKYADGIIGLSACLGGEVQQYLLNRDYEGAKNIALEYEEILGKGNFFLELQDHNIREQEMVNKGLIEISRETGIGLVATNDVHYLRKEDAIAHDVLLCIQTGRTVDEKNRMKFPSNQFYLKSPEEMYDLFKGQEEALLNTYKIAQRCKVEIDFDTLHLPEYNIPEGYTNESYLKKLTLDGLKDIYGELDEEIMERYDYEMDTIINMGYTDYFLIVWDFIKFAKENDIMVGPGRGSAAGSLISYGLGITGIDPLKYGLLFERFLNPERVTMPDIDIDFCYERREEVIDYVIDKYGEDRVAQIVTFGTMAARGSIRDVGRALNMPYGDVDRVAKEIPTDLGMTIEKALRVNKKLREMYENDEKIRVLIDYALAMEGLPRHTSTHAAGVLISKEPVTNFVPLLRNGDAITTQFNMTELEELGLLKMDFLGLRTLTVIRDAIELIKYNHGKIIDLEKINYEDAEVLEMFARAETLGVFQFESPGMRRFLKDLKPNVFENLIAANSLYRPGPMDQIPTFVERKHDESKVKYIHPKLEDILKETYGVIVYQEQVMQIVRDIGGYSMGQADLVRRAMGKKEMDVMERERKNFIYGKLDEEGNVEIAGAIRNGVDEKSANKIFDLMIDFANYAFNKSHSAAYALIAFQTAWLKHYYPVEFMAAQISSVMGDTNQVSLYIQECKRLNIEILPPSINESFHKFAVSNGKIRFGLTAVKNVGTNIISSIIKARKDGEFTSFTDFIERIAKIDSTSINRRAIESLIKAGAMDELGGNRAQYLAVYERIIDGILKDTRSNIIGQASLFDTMEIEEDTDNLPELNEFPQKALLSMEKEVLGIYVSGHPLGPYEEDLKIVSNISTSEIYIALEDEDNKLRDNQRIRIGGIVTEKKNHITKKNDMMAFLKIEDMYGAIECIIFPRAYENYGGLLVEDGLIVIDGSLSLSEDEPKILCNKIYALEEYTERLKESSNYGSDNDSTKDKTTEKLYIKISKGMDLKIINDAKDILKDYRGDTPVYLYIEENGSSLVAEEEYWVKSNRELIYKLEKLLGSETAKIVN